MKGFIPKSSRILIFISILSLSFLFNGCFQDDIDEINEKINSLIDENNLLKQGNAALEAALSQNTANDASSQANINTSISEVGVSLETVKANLTKSIEDLSILQES